MKSKWKTALMRINVITSVKIAAGSVLAILAARFLGLEFASSAGIITLLSVMNTRKETLKAAGKRCIAFLIAMALSNGIFFVLGYHVWAYGMFLFLFYFAVSALRVTEGFSMSAVLVTHLLGNSGFSAKGVRNEAGLFVIGVVMGILVNSYMPNRRGRIRRLQEEIEDRMRGLIRGLALGLRGEETKGLKEQIKQNGESLRVLEKEALDHVGNTFSKDSLYFVRYVEMRMNQNAVLENMAEHLEELTDVTPQALRMAVFFEYIGSTFRETNNAQELLEKLDELLAEYKRSELPEEREEFENRARLFHILQMMEYFLKLKKKFADSMTNEEKEQFWDVKMVNE